MAAREPEPPDVLPSAHRHGIAPEDAQHAWAHAMWIYEAGDEMLMYIGPARDGTLLEVGTVTARDDAATRELIADAMKARPKFLPGR